MSKDTVMVTREAWNEQQEYIKSLEKDADFLRALESHGVDNWSGYSDAYCEVYGDDDE